MLAANEPRSARMTQSSGAMMPAPLVAVCRYQTEKAVWDGVQRFDRKTLRLGSAQVTDSGHYKRPDKLADTTPLGTQQPTRLDAVAKQ